MKNKQKKLITADQINGMLILLNKLYWKLPEKQARYIIAKANDLPGLYGHFVMNNDEDKIIYVTNLGMLKNLCGQLKTITDEQQKFIDKLKTKK